MLSFAAIQHMPPRLALAQIAISEAFAALGYVSKLEWASSLESRASSRSRA